MGLPADVVEEVVEILAERASVLADDLRRARPHIQVVELQRGPARAVLGLVELRLAAAREVGVDGPLVRRDAEDAQALLTAWFLPLEHAELYIVTGPTGLLVLWPLPFPRPVTPITP